ncbi:hypothetical protein OU798_10555 [Prolixibacteraceae bacterium Z1-6]|uniref:HYR domain-containing protein n=1 Tax=Draconibacterium aestuarii TaxID=2998507 RepID=A0A9X3F6P9_9BACT|nr:hypothetical protein [Prolixibacteraceae bacterium Z1-6]
MKKISFILLMIFTLAFVANDAKAQGKFAPYPGGTYSYTLPIAIANQSDATLTATGLTTGTSSISNISPSLTDIGTGVTSITFDVTYSDDATGTCTLEFIITDEVSGCKNQIYVDIPMSALPIYTLTIDTDVSAYNTCQARNGVGDNSADALGTDIVAEKNTFTFEVTPDVQNVSGTFSYSYTIDLPDNLVLNTFNNGASGVTAYSGGVVTYNNVTSVVTDVFTVTFNTTTGEATQDLTATLTAGASSTLTVADGGGTYNATMATGGSLSETVSVNAVPTIGTFQ